MGLDSLLVHRSTFARNTVRVTNFTANVINRVGVHAGALSTRQVARAEVRDCVFEGNVAPMGGAIHVASSDALVHMVRGYFPPAAFSVCLA